MKWRNVNLILGRELRDQLRDRRTIFTILVMPLLLYPLLGMALLQVSQFSREHPTRVWIVGSENLPASPQLISDRNINDELLAAAGSPKIELVFGRDDRKVLSLVKALKSSQQLSQSDDLIDRLIQQELAEREADLAVVVSAPLSSTASDGSSESEMTGLPKLYVFSNSAKDKSVIAAQRFNQILARYKHSIAMQILTAKKIESASLDSFAIENSDVADEKWKQASTWSKVLPFIVMIWSLTGAFYPAVDLCAGEKERGTFETLLSSPALRNEIAIGKLLTVISFSIVTSVLNLLSMGFTGMFVVSRLGAQLSTQSANMVPLGMPPVSSLLWLLLALIPISALFSAVALAAASFAKSSKEGQYYLVPLMMISMPLMMLPMLPAAKLDLGTSLIPVSGLMLMLRGLIEGRHAEVLRFIGPVAGVTLTCCWLAIRWVVIQFNRESVIFVPSERFGVNVWLKQVMRDRAELPLAGHALLCGVLILVIKFFVSIGATVPESFFDFSRQTVIVLVASVAMPAVLMAMFLTRNPAKSLKLRTCRMPVACAAVLAAICLHPVVTWLTNLVLAIYPPSGDLAFAEQIMGVILADAPGLWAIILVLAVAPAIIEELAFRGFILSGLQSLGGSVKAVLVSAILFGAAHSILQQSIITFFIGCLLGFIAIRTKSLIPCILYHLTHNGISTSISMIGRFVDSDAPIIKLLFNQSAEGGYEYAFIPAIAMTIVGVALIVWFWKYREEEGFDGRVDSAARLMNLRSFVSKGNPQ